MKQRRPTTDHRPPTADEPCAVVGGSGHTTARAGRRSSVVGRRSSVVGPKRRAIFLDRDGVINYNRADYVKSPGELVMLPGSAVAVARLHAAGWPVFLISNQAGVGRGVMSELDLAAVTRKLERALADAGAVLSGIYYCAHHPEAGCDCRKPAPGLLLRAAREHDLDLARSFFIGDDPRDLRAGHAAGVPTILVLSGISGEAHAAAVEPPPAHVAADLSAAVDWVLSQED